MNEHYSILSYLLAVSIVVLTIFSTMDELNIVLIDERLSGG